MAQFVVYPTPLDAEVKLSPDSGGTIILSPYTAPDGRPGQVGEVADSTPSGHGATITVEAPGKQPLRLRGFLVHDATVARLQVDDYVLADLPTAPPEPGPTPPSGPRTPLQIIEGVYASGLYNLATHDGCGLFTEACCDALHHEHSPMWGHIAKSGGQNQFNGHAVDALMLLANAPGTAAGIYDIIYSSVSYEAKPVFNYVEPPNYDLWYYPAAARSRGVVLVAVPALIPRE